MSSIRRIAALLLAAAAGMAPLSGCEEPKPSEEQEKAVEAAIEAARVTPEQRAEARNWLNAEAWTQTVRSAIPSSAGLDEYRFRLHLRALMDGSSHRLAGYEDGSIPAGRYVERVLKAIGVDEVYAQEFPVVQPVTTECELHIDGEKVAGPDEILPVRPNIIQASVTPAEGLSGRTLYVGGGELEQYPELPDERIVVMDYAAGPRWETAFALGARAVIFIGPEDDTPAERPWHHANVPANLPRFYVPADVAERLELRRPQQVTVKAACEWRELTGRNVIGVIRGRMPEFGGNRAEALLLSAPLDSYSEVPQRSPGARGAANAAALLRAAEVLQEDRPRRDVILCFFDGVTQNFAGARALYGSIFRGKKGIKASSLEDRLTRYRSEMEFWEATTAFTERILERWDKHARAERLAAEGKPVPQSLKDEIARLFLFSDATAEWDNKKWDKHHRVVVQLRDEARYIDSEVLDRLRPLRVAIVELRQEIDALAEQKEALSETEDDDKRRRELQGRIDRAKATLNDKQQREHELAVEDLTWNSVERALHEEYDVLDPQVVKEMFKDVRDPERRKALMARTPHRYRELAERVRSLARRRGERLNRHVDRVKQALVLREAIGPGRNNILLHLNVNFGDDGTGWTMVHGDDTLPLEDDKAGEYQDLFKAGKEIWQENASALQHFRTDALEARYPNRLFAPAKFADAGSVARLFGIRNLAAVTSMDRRARQGQPVDTLKALDTDRMVPQVRELAVFVAELANSKDIAGLRPAIKPDALYAETRWDNNDRAGGPSVKRAGGGSAMADIPVRGAVVVVAPFQDGPWNAGDLNKTPPGYNHVLLSRTDVSGTFEVPVYFRPYYQASVLFSGAFDRPRTESVENLQPGQPERTRSRGILTGTTASQSMRAGATLRNTLITQFESRSMSFAGYGFNRRKLSTTAMRAMSTASFRPDRHLICELGNIVTVYAPYDADGLKVFNKAAIVLLNNTDTKAGHRGRGLPLADQFAHPSTPFTTANDLLNLEHYRLFDLLGKNHIKQPSLVRLWTEAHDLYQQSLAARTWLQKHGGNPDREAPTEELPEPYQATQREHLSEKCASDAAAAANLTRGAYEPTVGVMNDLVTAVVLLLLLAMPFAYALERLLIGTPHIYRQIGWFAGLFVLTFAVLYLVNPAFRIASTPVIIFLAFAIILLSCLVIFIMVRKLQTEIRRMQGLASTVHSADVSRLGTMLAAVNMGISTMRRRPLRTFLTAATVVLLTFTILTFASFGSRWGVRETYEGPMSGPPRILVRHQLLSPVARGTYDMLRGHFRGRAEVVPRYWVSPSAAEAQEATKTGESHDILAWVEDADEKTLMRAAVGLDPRDVEHQPGLARMFDPLALTEDERRINEQRRAEDREELTRQEIIARRLGDNGVFLTDAVREALKLRTDDVGRAIRLGQRRLSFAGVIRDEFGGHTMLEGTSPLPVNYQALAGATGQQTQDTGATTLVETQEASSAQFVHFNVDGVAVIPASVARIMSDRIVSLTLYPRESGDVGAIGHRTAQLAKLPTYAGQRGGVQRLLFTSLTEASGVRDLFIPVVLGGMIVFATMLGSVSDREREIYTFSSLGLAPPHVAGLFFAEASIYAVVGGMGGYLLGQGVARLLGWLSGLVEFDVPTMNYSSTNAIVTILIVMGTVMVSTIYPALKASRSANPGIQRQWRIPKPAGNLYDLMFPFTVSAYDITGVVSFLKEHFDNFQDASLGDFATTRCRIVRQKDNDMLGFEATVALAPFDLGVNQRFALLSRPSDIEGIDEVRILIYRLSGANGDWQRSNRTFINNLRKQLLIWRSLPQDVMDNYRQKTLQMWDELPVERIDPETIAQSASEMHASDDQEPAR